MNRLLQKIYYNNPNFIKKVIKNTWTKFVPFPYVYGLEFADFYRFLMKSQWWPKEKLEEFQNQRLRKIIEHAYDNVPYYRKIFDVRGLRPKDIQCKEDLRKLPILTKEDLRKNFNELMAKDFEKFKPILSHTSGSTGIPMKYYLDKNNFIWENAFVCRH